MMLGMSLETFTLLHVVISLVGIGSGFVVLFGLINGWDRASWTSTFLITTVLTSVTGFMFPFERLLPSHKVGILSLVILALAIAARYVFHVAGIWRPVYVLGSTIALYLNVFVLLAQSFQKIPALKALAPTETEPAFFVAQTVVLVAFVGLSILATRRFRPQPAPAI